MRALKIKFSRSEITMFDTGTSAVFDVDDGLPVAAVVRACRGVPTPTGEEVWFYLFGGEHVAVLAASGLQVIGDAQHRGAADYCDPDGCLRVEVRYFR